MPYLLICTDKPADNPNAWSQIPACLAEIPQQWLAFIQAMSLALDAAAAGTQPDAFAIWAGISSTGVMIGAPQVDLLPGGTGAPGTTEWDAGLAAMTTIAGNIATLHSPAGNGHSDTLTKAAADWTAPGEVYV